MRDAPLGEPVSETVDDDRAADAIRKLAAERSERRAEAFRAMAGVGRKASPRNVLSRSDGAR